MEHAGTRCARTGLLVLLASAASGASSQSESSNKETVATLKKSERNVGVKAFNAPEEAFAQWDHL